MNARGTSSPRASCERTTRYTASGQSSDMTSCGNRRPGVSGQPCAPLSGRASGGMRMDAGCLGVRL
jgi:hypothetical protein